MAPSTITATIAHETDAPALASLITACFSAGDAAYNLIWGGAEPGLHDKMAVVGLFTPVQKENVVTYKAVDSTTGTIVGFTKWILPKAKVEGEKKGGGGLPDLPGVNMELWNEKTGAWNKVIEKDQDPTKDFYLSLCFVHPDYQRQGIASLLLQWGIQKADEARAKLWCMSTPQAIAIYAKNGWEVVNYQEVDLTKYGGEGIYTRAWMLRKPKNV